MSTITRTPSRPRNGRPANVRPQPSARPAEAPATRSTNGAKTAPSANGKTEPVILFQKFFKSIGPRTYAAQLKELSNGNHLLVLTEGKRTPEGEPRKTRLFIYGEDFSAFFHLLQDVVAFIRANPVSEDVRRRRTQFWNRKSRKDQNKNP